MAVNALQYNSISDIEQLVTERAEESTTLEFKRKCDPNLVDLQRTDKKLLGETVSGFANAAGGTLILGVGTENHNGIDRASALFLIKSVELVAARYQAYVSECVSPAVEGLVVSYLSNSDGDGLVVIIVPSGQSRPHMSRAPDHHTYYRRVIDRFVPMEAYEVEEMMRIKTAPDLAFVHELRKGGSIGDNREINLLFGLENVGRVTARFPYVEYLGRLGSPTSAEYGLDGNGRTLWPRILTATTGALFAAGSDSVIHPGQKLFVSKIDMCEFHDPRFPRSWGLSQIPSGGQLNLNFAYGAEDHPRKTSELEFQKEALLGFVRPSTAGLPSASD